MGSAISACFSKYATFSGRATRSEYWYFVLFNVIVSIGGVILDTAIGTSFIQNLFTLALFLPGLAVAVRRMHDVGKSGWFMLIPFYNLILVCTASTGDNQYGARV